MEKYFTPEANKTYNFAPYASSLQQPGMTPTTAAYNPTVDMDIEDIWMMQQMKSQMQIPQIEAAAPQAQPVTPSTQPVPPTSATSTPMNINSYMQQKMQMKIMKCQMKCNWKCSAYSMNNPQLMQQCLALCPC